MKLEKIAVIFCVLVWGSSYVAVKIGLSDFAPDQLASYRFFVASLVSLGLMIVRKNSPLSFADLLRLTPVSAIGIFAYHISLNFFLERYPPNMVSFVSNTAPIFILIFSKFLLAEHLQRIRWFGFSVALAGIFVMNMGQPLTFGWETAGLLAIPISGSLFFVLQKPLLRTLEPEILMHHCIIVGTLMLLLWDVSFFQVLPGASIQSHIAIIYLGIVPTVAAFQIWTYLLAKRPVSHLAAPVYLVPPSTILFAIITLGTWPSPWTILGGLLCMAGVGLSQKNSITPPSKYERD